MNMKTSKAKRILKNSTTPDSDVMKDPLIKWATDCINGANAERNSLAHNATGDDSYVKMADGSEPRLNVSTRNTEDLVATIPTQLMTYSPSNTGALSLSNIGTLKDRKSTRLNSSH